MLRAAAALPFLSAADAAEPQKTISYVRAASASDIDAHAAFGWEMLSAALEKTRATHGDYSLTVSPDAAQALRFRHARTSSDIQVNTVVLTISPIWGDILLPVRIPFMRGLLGYRLLLVHRTHLDRFAGIRTLSDLKKIWNAKFGPTLEKYDLAHRTLIEIPDPLLSPEDPIQDPRYWYRPGERRPLVRTGPPAARKIRRSSGPDRPDGPR